MNTKSYWIETGQLPRFPRPSANVTVDVVVVGGGITGITAAYLLKKAGLTVALLERGRFARVDTGNTTAHLTRVTDSRLHHLIKVFGADAARAVWDAGGAAIDQIANLIRTEDIRCDFNWLPGYLHAPLSAVDGAAATLEQEAAAADRLDIQAEYVAEIPTFRVPGVKFPHQAIFHPRKYLAALLRTIEGGGSHVFENTLAEKITDEPLTVQSGEYQFHAGYLVLATHTPLMGNTGLVSALLFQTKLSLYTSYALSARVPTGSLALASFWDTGDPYYYLRVERRRGYDVAVFGGEDHKTGQEADTVAAYTRLERKFRSFAPKVEIDHRWSGQVIMTNDGLPFIGETAAGQFAATGFGGNGMTFGTLGAMMAVDAALERPNPWQELFNLDRKKLFGGTWTYLKENKDYPYFMARDWLAGSTGDSLNDLRPREGRILNLAGRKVAAHRDAKGKVTLCSPVCTHLQCIVAWNNAEETWDCPCHGSRFKPTGEVISGPAEEPLKPIEFPARKGKPPGVAVSPPDPALFSIP